MISPFTEPAEDKDGSLAAPPAPSQSLAPGTASGAAARPRKDPKRPSTGTSGSRWSTRVPRPWRGRVAEELNKAIATGIPSVIRGVIWQVLAQSKNEELEACLPRACRPRHREGDQAEQQQDLGQRGEQQQPRRPQGAGRRRPPRSTLTTLAPTALRAVARREGYGGAR